MNSVAFLRVENLLTTPDRDSLLQFVAARQDRFVAAQVLSGEPNFRAAMVLNESPGVYLRLRELITYMVPVLTRAFGIADFYPSSIETQLTAHPHGAYFKPHRDNASAVTSRRKISYVYYFNKEPRTFTGGELALFGLGTQTPRATQAEAVIEPLQNTMVFFESGRWHEVRPVCCSTAGLVEARLTLNGWILG